MPKVLMGNIRGPKGDKGDKGDAGVPGAVGPAGPNTIPTNQAIADAIAVDGPARSALNDTIASSVEEQDIPGQVSAAIASDPTVAEAAADAVDTALDTSPRIPTVTSDDFAWRVTDRYGRTPVGVRDDGTVFIGGAPIEVSGGYSWVPLDKTTGFVGAIMDAQRNACFTVNIHGEVDLAPTAALIARIAGSMGSRFDPRTQPVYRVLLGAGQSNMHGPGIGWDATKDITPSGLDQWNCTVGDAAYDTIVPAAEPVAARTVWRTPGGAPRTSVLMEMGRQLLFDTPPPEKVLIVPAALGSTTMATRWNPDTGDLYAWAIARFQAAIAALPAGSTVEAFVWAQGESDAGTMTTAVYQSYLERIYEGVVDVVGYEIPFIVNGMVPEWVGTDAGRLAIQDALRGAAEAFPLGRFVPGPTGFQEPTETVHYNAGGTRRLGRLDFAALRSIQLINGLVA